MRLGKDTGEENPNYDSGVLGFGFRGLGCWRLAF